MLLLLDHRNDKHYTGDKLSDLIANVDRIRFDLDGRRAVIDGKPDTVTIGRDYDDGELLVELARRALDVLVRHHGWTLFTSKD